MCGLMNEVLPSIVEGEADESPRKTTIIFPRLVEGSDVPTPHDICNICMSHRLSFLWFPQRWASGMQRYFPRSTSGHSHNVTTPYCYDIKATKPRDQLVPLRRDQSLQMPAQIWLPGTFPVLSWEGPVTGIWSLLCAQKVSNQRLPMVASGFCVPY